MNPFFHTDFSISDSLKNVRKSVLNYETIIKQKTARKLTMPYWSVFTCNMSICYITGATDYIEPHHIFNGPRKSFSEKYGFMLPLRHDWHVGTDYAIHVNHQLNLEYKLLCQKYWLENMKKTKKEWISETGKWWVDENEPDVA